MKQIDMLLDGICAVMFDIDGTLVDSMGIWPEIDRSYIERYGKKVPADIQRAMSGYNMRQAAEYFRNVIGIDESPEKMINDWNEMAFDQYRNHVQAKPGAIKFVHELYLRGIKMAAGTTNTKQLSTAVLESQGFMPYFQTVVNGDEIEFGKPDPFVYLECARRLGIDPSKCLVFEDIPAGIEAGRAAGMRICAVWDSYAAAADEEKRLKADYYIHDFEDIFSGRIEMLQLKSRLNCNIE